MEFTGREAHGQSLSTVARTPSKPSESGRGEVFLDLIYSDPGGRDGAS